MKEALQEIFRNEWIWRISWMRGVHHVTRDLLYEVDFGPTTLDSFPIWSLARRSGIGVSRKLMNEFTGISHYPCGGFHSKGIVCSRRKRIDSLPWRCVAFLNSPLCIRVAAQSPITRSLFRIVGEASSTPAKMSRGKQLVMLVSLLILYIIVFSIFLYYHL